MLVCSLISSENVSEMFIASIYRVKNFCNEVEEICSSETMLTTADSEWYLKNWPNFTYQCSLKYSDYPVSRTGKEHLFFTCSLKDYPNRS